MVVNFKWDSSTRSSTTATFRSFVHLLDALIDLAPAYEARNRSFSFLFDSLELLLKLFLLLEYQFALVILRKLI